VLDGEGDPIDGLYAVGSCAALLSSGTGYNSGFALGRRITLAYLAAHEPPVAPPRPRPPERQPCPLKRPRFA
jgi:3-oxosteroid 1-dehydrogenase